MKILIFFVQEIKENHSFKYFYLFLSIVLSTYFNEAADKKN